jgi:hypothetical protein
MSYNFLTQRFKLSNRNLNLHINDRYNKKPITLESTLNNINKSNNDENVNQKNYKTISNIDSVKRMEDIKNKYNQINFQKTIDSRIAYNKVLNLKKKYFKQKNDNSNELEIINNFKNNRINTSSNIYKIENPDKISMTTKSWNKKTNLTLQKDDNLNEHLYYSEKKRKSNFKKSKEINYQIKSMQNNDFKIFKNSFNINVYKNNFINTNNFQKQFKNLDKRINNLLLKDEKKFINNNEFKEEVLKNEKRNKSASSIKERITLLTDAKREIKKIYKDSYEVNDNTQNSSNDSQITLGFKHIKPIIKKENLLENYFTEKKPNKMHNKISKPILIKTLKRPKFEVPNYFSLFYK